MFSLIYPLIALQSATAAEPPAQPAPPPAACTDAVHDGFDLWVGEWDVFPNGRDNQVATSRIERLSGGCTIREQWMPFQGAGGISLSAVNHNTGRWEQTWVGSDGKRVDFEGGVVDGAMVLTGYWDDIGGPGNDALIRMTYSRQDNGSVRQYGQASTDHGLTWQDSFDLIYRPKDRETP
jgi:hypothetical protein